MHKINGSKAIFFLGAGAIFLLMLVCNVLTRPCADDFVYMYSFSTGEKITSVFQIFPSMARHYITMNGRVGAHFFAQLFFMLPGAVFDILNSLIFVLFIFLIYKICNVKSNFFFLAVFSLVWIFTLSFGQVYLWLDGGCNYLWAMVFQLIFIYPFVMLSKEKYIENKFLKCLFVLFSFFSGGYSENISIGAIVTAVSICILWRKNLKKEHFMSLFSAMAGYIFLMCAPSEWKNKAGEFSVYALRENFYVALKMYLNFLFPLIAYVIFLLLPGEKERKRLSLCFFAGSLLSNFILILAGYYPGRSACFSLALLICALGTVSFSKNKAIFICICALISAANIYFISQGVSDIFQCYRQYEKNEEKIIASVKGGIKDIKIPDISPKTKYPAFYDLKYIDTKNPYSWPNKSMANYYGAKKIRGISP